MVVGISIDHCGAPQHQVFGAAAKRADKAFTAAELAEEFETDHRTLRTVLARLHARGLVDKKGDYWFAFNDEDAAAKRAFLLASRDLDRRHGPEDPKEWRRRSLTRRVVLVDDPGEGTRDGRGSE